MTASEKVNELYQKEQKERNRKYYLENREKILQKRHEAYVKYTQDFAERNKFNYAKRKAAKNEGLSLHESN